METFILFSSARSPCAQRDVERFSFLVLSASYLSSVNMPDLKSSGSSFYLFVPPRQARPNKNN